MTNRERHLDGAEHVAGGSEFGTLLRAHRRRIRLTQQALAQLSTVSSRTIRDIETGRVSARPRTVELLADGLGLTGLAREAFIQAVSPVKAPRGRGELDTEPPHAAGTLYGRDSEVRALVHAIASQHRRAICVLGLGGVGKSRTALEVARRLYTQRSWPVLWVSAGQRPHGQPATRGELRGEIHALLQAARPDHAHLSHLCGLFGTHDILLVLDGVGHLTAAANEVLQHMLGRCPGLRIIVTSRSPLLLAGYQPAIVDPLPIPPDADVAGQSDELSSVPSVQLLVERLAEIHPGWMPTAEDMSAVATLCRRVDGLPLALEVAAHQGHVLSLRELAALPPAELVRLGAPSATGRMASIRETIDASCRLLDDSDVTHLRTLATLAPTWSLSDAEAALQRPRAEVVNTLGVLIRAGLIRRRHGDQMSYFTVPNLVRGFLHHPVG